MRKTGRTAKGVAGFFLEKMSMEEVERMLQALIKSLENKPLKPQ